MAYTKQEIIAFVDTSHYLVVSGTNTYTASSTPALQSYVTGKPFWCKFTNSNTAAATFNIDSLGAITIYKSVGTALVPGDIQALSMIELVYDGTNFQAIGGAILFLTISQKINSAAANFSQTII